MKWKKYTVLTTTEAEDLVSMMLCELGAGGVQIEDNVPLTEAETKGMFVDILPELPPDEGESRVSFFLHMAEAGEVQPKTGKPVKPAEPAEPEEPINGVKTENTQKAAETDMDTTVDASYTIDDRVWSEEEAAALLKAVHEGLEEMRAYAEIGEGTITETETADVDWMNNWKQYFTPFTVGSILIKPSWEEVPEEFAEEIRTGRLKTLEIDPGAAFGTGSHETTKLCMLALSEHVRGGEKVLDIGTGSGILGITALKYGADSVTATDLDEACVDAVADNRALNGIEPERFRLMIGNILTDPKVKAEAGIGLYDIVIANILAPVIIGIARTGTAAQALKPGGLFIASGILDKKEEEVLEALEASGDWNIVSVKRMGEWSGICAVKR